VNAMYVDQNRSKPDVVFQNSIVDEKLQRIEKTLVQISLNTISSKQPKSILQNNSSQNTRKSSLL
jgi:hypothetical protein